jgi:hypothetical protein
MSWAGFLVFIGAVHTSASHIGPRGLMQNEIDLFTHSIAHIHFRENEEAREAAVSATKEFSSDVMSSLEEWEFYQIIKVFSQDRYQLDYERRILSIGFELVYTTRVDFFRYTGFIQPASRQLAIQRVANSLANVCRNEGRYQSELARIIRYVDEEELELFATAVERLEERNNFFTEIHHLDVLDIYAPFYLCSLYEESGNWLRAQRVSFLRNMNALLESGSVAEITAIKWSPLLNGPLAEVVRKSFSIIPESFGFRAPFAQFIFLAFRNLRMNSAVLEPDLMVFLDKLFTIVTKFVELGEMASSKFAEFRNTVAIIEYGYRWLGVSQSKHLLLKGKVGNVFPDLLIMLDNILASLSDVDSTVTTTEALAGSTRQQDDVQVPILVYRIDELRERSDEQMSSFLESLRDIVLSFVHSSTDARRVNMMNRVIQSIFDHGMHGLELSAKVKRILNIELRWNGDRESHIPELVNMAVNSGLGGQLLDKLISARLNEGSETILTAVENFSTLRLAGGVVLDGLLGYEPRDVDKLLSQERETLAHEIERANLLTESRDQFIRSSEFGAAVASYFKCRRDFEMGWAWIDSLIKFPEFVFGFESVTGIKALGLERVSQELIDIIKGLPATGFDCIVDKESFKQLRHSMTALEVSVMAAHDRLTIETLRAEVDQVVKEIKIVKRHMHARIPLIQSSLLFM